MMLLDYFWVFCWISRKMDEISKSWQFRGPTPRRRDPTRQRKSTLRRGMSMPRCGREGGLDKPRVRRGVALFTNMCFCHDLLFRYSEDLSIGLMRTLLVYERVHSCL